MILIHDILGHRDDPHWVQTLAGRAPERLLLNQWDAQKNRLRTVTDSGLEIAISLPRKTFMKDGDVLYFNAETGQALVVEIALREVLVIELDTQQPMSPELLMRTCFELGHALGNQHWPAVVKGHTFYVPLTVDQKVMGSVMRTHQFEHIQYRFVPGSEVIRYLAPHESRRLFAGADSTPHVHYDQLVAAGAEGAGAPGTDGAHPHAHPHPHEVHAHPHAHEGQVHSHAHPHGPNDDDTAGAQHHHRHDAASPPALV